MSPDSSGQQQPEAAAPSLESVVFGVIDLETTGLFADRDRILELGLVVQRDGAELERFSALVNPGEEIPAEVTALTGIGEADLQGAPALGPALQRLATTLERRGVDVLVAHNARFDRGFLERAWAEHGRSERLPPFLCTLQLSYRLLRGEGYSLDALARRLDLPVGARHRALGDAEITAALLRVLLERARRKRVHSLPALFALEQRPRPVLWRLWRRLTRPWRRWRRASVDDANAIR